MAYRLTGTYVVHCDCQQICPCPVDEPPTGRNGACHGLIVASIRDGKLDGTDVSGVNVAIAYSAPGKLSDGNLRMGLVVDDGASDEQTAAVERIFKGDEGGLFEAFGALTSDWLGVDRASISFSDGDEPSAKIGDTDVTFVAFRDPSGAKTTARNAPSASPPSSRSGSHREPRASSAIRSRPTTVRRPSSSGRAERTLSRIAPR